MTAATPAALSARDTLWRTLQTFAFTRTLIVAVLLGYFGWAGTKALHEHDAFWQICVVYMVLALGFVLLATYWRHRFLWQVALQISLDLTVISALYLAVGGLKSGLAILYLFPLAGGAILAPLVLSLFFVSVATLVMLAESGYQLLSANDDISSTQVGLYCGAFFIIIFAINRLADRLIKQESLAQGRGRALQVQQAINRLVIEDMEDGVVVIDRGGRLLTGNPAAAGMLGISLNQDQGHGSLRDFVWLAPIAEAFAEWRQRESDEHAEAAFFVHIRHADDSSMLGGSTLLGGTRLDPTMHLQLRFARVPTGGEQEGRIVLFLQDVSAIENRAQQLKLASMGRLTASIAHEVRNPLSAIGHAASLLSEDETDDARRRLLKIVNDNVARLNRMIEDILKLSRKADHDSEPILLAPLLDEIVTELREMQQLAPALITISHTQNVMVRFDPLHLREIILNLLTNALRYASGAPGSIRLHVVYGTRIELHVQDDGPEMTASVRAHLFEPFYTTSSKGTGLGLYLARELCLNNGALLNYEYRNDGEEYRSSGRFVITFAAAGGIQEK